MSMWMNWNSHILIIGMYSGKTTWETKLEFSQNLFKMGWGKWWGKEVGGWIWNKKRCTHVYKRKKYTCWSHSRNEGRGNKGECIIYLIHCKNFYKCHNVPPPSTTIKKVIFQREKKTFVHSSYESCKKKLVIKKIRNNPNVHQQGNG
jgi:hypothetical protein